MRIRKTQDEEAVWALHRKTLSTDELYKDQRNHYWLAKDGDDPVAFGILTPIGHGIGFLSRSGVLPSARGKGLQRRLIRSRVNYAKRLGLNRIITYTALTNGPSIKSLLLCGFQIFEPEYAWAGDKQLYFIKKL